MTRNAYTTILALVPELTKDQRVGILRALREERAETRNINDHIQRWCDKRKTTHADMRAVCRAHSVSALRQSLMAYLSSRRFSSVEIGIALNRDHSTVLEGVRAHRERTAKFNREKARTRATRGVAA